MARLTTTGIPPLDVFLEGGLPRGFTTLLLAPPGSGGEIFAKQFAADHDQERVVYFTTDEPRDEVLDAVEEAGWSFEGVEVHDLQTDFAEAMMEAQQEAFGDATPMKEPEPPKKRSFDPRALVEGTSSRDVLQRRGKRPAPSDGPEKASGKGPHDTDYLGRLMRPYTKIRHPDRVVVHSMDFFLNLYPVDQVISALTAIKAANAKAGGQLLLVLAKGAHGATTERRLELMADCLIELEVTRKGTSFDRFFLVRKVKNRTVGIGVSTYQIGPTGFELETLERIV